MAVLNWKAYISKTSKKEFADEKLRRYKSFGHNVELESQDTSHFLIYMNLQSTIKDTARQRISLANFLTYPFSLVRKNPERGGTLGRAWNSAGGSLALTHSTRDPVMLRTRFKLDVRIRSSVEAIDRSAKKIRVRDLASGKLSRTEFLAKFGHRGTNHPVKHLASGKVEITSQNHGFAVDPATIPADVEVTHLSLYNDSVEGLKHKSRPIFCVQYHPEAAPGPHDADYLFREFLDAMEARA